MILYRESQIPFLPNEVAHLKAPIVQPSKARFADFEDIMTLPISFIVGTLLLMFVQAVFPNKVIDAGKQVEMKTISQK